MKKLTRDRIVPVISANVSWTASPTCSLSKIKNGLERVADRRRSGRSILLDVYWQRERPLVLPVAASDVLPGQCLGAICPLMELNHLERLRLLKMQKTVVRQALLQFCRADLIIP
jgi:hypothetical protein